MTTQLQEYINTIVPTKTTIDPQEEVRIRIDFLKQYLVNAGQKGYVLGISGGVDSALAGYLGQTAVNELNTENPGAEYKFIAMKLPYGVQKDATDVETVLNWLQPDETITVNIKDTVDAFAATFAATGTNLADYHKGNVKARARMIAQYAVAGQTSTLVLGTDQNPEYCLGFFSLGGDGQADLSPNFGLNKRQIRAILATVGLPKEIIWKAPTADLLDNNPGQPDEFELGITYDQIDDYLEGKDIDPEAAEKIERQFLKTEHKRQPIVNVFDTWWK